MGNTALKLNEREIKCPACAEIILSEAKKCKHCGELLDKECKSKEGRSVSVFLGVAILLLPYIFSWFTLRKGYSKKAKVISFLWMALVLGIALNKNNSSVTSSRANVGNTGSATSTIANTPKLSNLWSVGRYVDHFGDPTKEGYITNKEKIKGQFSNSATTNSDLLVDFLINSPRSIEIMLYEYARPHPVKSYGSTNYSIFVKDKNEKKYNLGATNYSDRLRLDAASSAKLHKILEQGGRVSFLITETSNNITQYQFVIQSADGYSDSYKQLAIKK